MSEPIRIPTGTGAQRRRLTLDEATAGYLPDRFTPDEWRAMHEAARRPSGPLPTEAPAMTDLEDTPEPSTGYHPPLRDPVAVPTAHSTPPDPSDAAADGAFGGRVDHRAGHAELTDIIAHARKGYDVRGSQAALLVGWIDMVTLRAEIAEAERDSLRHVLALLRQPSEDVCKTFGWNSVYCTADAIRAAVAAAEREAGR